MIELKGLEHLLLIMLLDALDLVKAIAAHLQRLCGGGLYPFIKFKILAHRKKISLNPAVISKPELI